MGELATICCQHILMFITQPKPEGQLQNVQATVRPRLLPQEAPVMIAKKFFVFMHLLQCLPGPSYFAIICTGLAVCCFVFNAHEWTFLVQVAWRQCCVKVAGEDWSVVSSKVNEHAVKASDLWAAFLADKKGFKP